MPRQKTKEEFILSARVTHGDRYDYSRSVYKGNKVRLEVGCPEHGFFWITPNSHTKVNGRGCPVCGMIRLKQFSETRRLSAEEYFKRAKEKHGDKFDYSQCGYTAAGANIKVICPHHGPIIIKAISHLYYGCRACAGLAPHTRETFVAAANEVHKGKYRYPNLPDPFPINKTEIVIECPEHGLFSQTINDHLDGHGCKPCGYRIVSAAMSGENNHGWIADREEAKLRKNIRQRCSWIVKGMLKRMHRPKNASTSELVGYGREALYDRITTHPNWNKVKNGIWHIDHIFPVVAFLNFGIMDLRLINALDNLRPLTGKENLKKNGRYNPREFLSYLCGKAVTDPVYLSTVCDMFHGYRPITASSPPH